MGSRVRTYCRGGTLSSHATRQPRSAARIPPDVRRGRGGPGLGRDLFCSLDRCAWLPGAYQNGLAPPTGRAKRSNAKPADSTQKPEKVHRLFGGIGLGSSRSSGSRRSARREDLEGAGQASCLAACHRPGSTFARVDRACPTAGPRVPRASIAAAGVCSKGGGTGTANASSCHRSPSPVISPGSSLGN